MCVCVCVCMHARAFTQSATSRSMQHTYTVHCMNVSSEGDAVRSLLVIASLSTLLHRNKEHHNSTKQEIITMFQYKCAYYIAFVCICICYTHLISFCFKMDADTCPPSTYLTSHPLDIKIMYCTTPYITWQVLFLETPPTDLATLM